MIEEKDRVEINDLKAKIGAFDAAKFGGTAITTDLFSAAAERAKSLGREFTPYAAPPKKPIADHPRVLFNRSDVPGICAALRDERNKVAASLFREAVEHPVDGDLGEKTFHEIGTYYYMNGTYNYDEEVLRGIQALALDYQLTGCELSGYRAIYALLNFLVTLDVERFSACGERQYGSIMYTAACVYDWCHGLTTDADRLKIVSGIEHKIVPGDHMEVEFPPLRQGSVSGHGCEFQILRDYLSFAIAIYDEYPFWWDFIGGRIYQEYVPARNEFYRAGMVPQGVSLYVRPRFSSDLFSAWLLKAGVGELPYDPAGMKQVMRTVYSYELPDGNGFASGDNHNPKTVDGNFLNYGLPAMISAYLFDDETMRAQLERGDKCRTKFRDDKQDCFEYPSVPEYLICSSKGVKAADDVHKDMDLLLFSGGWLGQTIARNGWDSDQAAVLMKVGARTGANHDHSDAGQFQIWYKGMLAGDTGVYDSYGDEHFKKYHQATISHNCLLIDGVGQKHVRESSGLPSWMTDAYKTGTVVGMQNGYADKQKTKPLYAYLAGDLTPSYDNVAGVTEVARRMLAVFDTKNGEIPLFFFVFDNVTADPSAKTTFLLHTKTEPTVENGTVTEISGDGKLVLQTVFGGDTITKIGGKKNNYVVDGVHVTDENSDDGFWGRVEISAASGNATDHLLNVTYVTDADKLPNALPATAIETDAVRGALIGGVAAVFVAANTRRSEPFAFPLTGSASCYVSGVKAGDWTVFAGGQTQTVTATEDGGLLTFTAPAGTVTLSPAN